MAVDLKLVKALRGDTGLGMMDCKRALEEAEGDAEKAMEILRKKGMAAADSRAHRSADQGRIAMFVTDDRLSGALIELRSESDFVSRGEDFTALVENLAEAAAKQNPGIDLETFLATPAPGGKGSVSDAVSALSGKVGERVVVQSVSNLPAPKAGATRLGGYVHHNARAGALIRVAYEKPGSADAADELLRILGMHVVAHSPTPVAVDKDGIPAEVIEKEKAIQSDTDEVKSKPEQIREKIVMGKMGRFIKDRALLEQLLVTEVEEKVTVGDALKRKGQELGDKFVVEHFVHFELG